MGRWDITGPDRIHSAELRGPACEPREQSNSTSPSVGHGGNSDFSSEEIQSRERPATQRTARAKERRIKHQDQGITYSLRSSEIEAMADVGRFRAVDVQDLARFVYQGDDARMKYDLNNLRGQGLIEQKTILGAHRAARRILTLTKRGERIARKIGGLPSEQRIYHGLVKPKELDHDADLYKVYQKAAKQVREKGGKVVRVRLDFELKESLNRAKEAAGQLPKDMRERWLAAVADEYGLKAEGAAIHLPDLQIEYQVQDGRTIRENLELVSRNYRQQGIQSKAAAGFTMYARAGETARIRRALRDTGLIREVLSL